MESFAHATKHSVGIDAGLFKAGKKGNCFFGIKPKAMHIRPGLVDKISHFIHGDPGDLRRFGQCVQQIAVVFCRDFGFFHDPGYGLHRGRCIRAGDVREFCESRRCVFQRFVREAKAGV